MFHFAPCSHHTEGCSSGHGRFLPCLLRLLSATHIQKLSAGTIPSLFIFLTRASSSQASFQVPRNTPFTAIQRNVKQHTHFYHLSWHIYFDLGGWESKEAARLKLLGSICVNLRDLISKALASQCSIFTECISACESRSIDVIPTEGNQWGHIIKLQQNGGVESSAHQLLILLLERAKGSVKGCVFLLRNIGCTGTGELLLPVQNYGFVCDLSKFKLLCCWGFLKRVLKCLTFSYSLHLYSRKTAGPSSKALLSFSSLVTGAVSLTCCLLELSCAGGVRAEQPVAGYKDPYALVEHIQVWNTCLIFLSSLIVAV